MKTFLNKVSKTIIDWRNNRRDKRIKNKFLGLYMDSVGRTYYSDPQNLGELRRNKERHKILWNRNLKGKGKKRNRNFG